MQMTGQSYALPTHVLAPISVVQAEEACVLLLVKPLVSKPEVLVA